MFSGRYTYREFLKTTASFEPRYIYALNEHSNMHGGNVYDQFNGSELADASKHYILHPDAHSTDANGGLRNDSARLKVEISLIVPGRDITFRKRVRLRHLPT